MGSRRSFHRKRVKTTNLRVALQLDNTMSDKPRTQLARMLKVLKIVF